MEKLDKETTELLIRFVDLIDLEDTYDVRIKRHPILHMEQWKRVVTDQGNGLLLSITFSPDKKRLTSQSRMEFIVVDKRGGLVNEIGLIAYPVSFEDGIKKVFEYACVIANNRVAEYSVAVQQGIAKRAYPWLNAIIIGGYADKPTQYP